MDHLRPASCSLDGGLLSTTQSREETVCNCMEVMSGKVEVYQPLSGQSATAPCLAVRWPLECSGCYFCELSNLLELGMHSQQGAAKTAKRRQPLALGSNKHEPGAACHLLLGCRSCNMPPLSQDPMHTAESGLHPMLMRLLR